MADARRKRALISFVGAAALVIAGLPALSGVRPASAAPPTATSCVAEQPDEAAARRMLEACKGRVEILAERTEYLQVFLNPDGSRTAEQTVEPVRVRQGGGWAPVDTTLKKTADGVAPKAAVLPMTFSGGGNALVGRLRDGDRELAINWPGTLPSPVLKGSTAVYPGVLPGVDLQVTAQATGFSEVLVVHSREAATNARLASLKFDLATKGVQVRAASGGGLAARDAKGDLVFAAPAPLMWDSSEPALATADRVPSQQRAQAEAAGEPSLEPAGGADRTRRAVMPIKVDDGSVTISPDKAMLTDPRTTYPVYIDPSVTGGIVKSQWTSVWSKYPTSSFWKNTTALTDGKTYGSAGAGRTEDCKGCADHIIRSIFQMDTNAVRGMQITGAQFRIEQRHAWTCNPSPTNAKVWLTGAFSSATTWKNQPTWNASYTAQTPGDRKVGSAHGCYGPGTIEFNVKNIVSLAASKGWTSTSFGLRAVSESTLSQWKRFNPSTAKLSIDYNRAPNAATQRQVDNRPCAVGAARPYVQRTTPTLSAWQSDPDGGQLTTDFYWWPQNGTRSESNKVWQTNGNNAPVSKAIPAGRLTDGVTYIWQTRTSDGALTKWSGNCEFTVDATAPPAPGGITSTDYSATTPKGGVGLAGTFNIAPPASGGTDIVAYAWTLDSGVMIASQTVPAAADRTGSITLKPAHDGINTLRVWAKDKAGWFSAQPVTFDFHVRAGSGPAAEWTFDEASGDATDVSQHGNTAVLAGSTGRVTGRGNTGSALSLNGSTTHASTAAGVTYPHPDTGTATAVRTDANFTVTARVRVASTSGVTGQRTIIAASGSRTSAYTLGYSGTDNRWRFAMAASDVDNAATVQVLSNAAPTAGKWTHLAATFDGTTHKLTLYVNGVAQTATATLTGGFNTTGAITIGKRKWNGADDGFFNGAVDDVRVYSFIETGAKLTELAAPLQPVITFPAGQDVSAGGSLQVTLDAGGDTNVTKFQYSLDSAGLTNTANASTPGGTATVTITMGSNLGEHPLFAVAVDDGNRVGPLQAATILVKAAAALSGSVVDQVNYLPVAGAVVTLQPGGLQATTNADGMFVFASINPGSYTVRASYGGRCGMAGAQPVLVDADGDPIEVYLLAVGDIHGHTCAEQTRTFAAAGTVLPLTGDDAVTTVQLPFAFPFYGSAYHSAWVDTNGLVSFEDPLGSHPRTAASPLISQAEPNAVIAPFWDDLVVDSSASVRAGVLGSGTAQQYVIEWRNVHRKGNTAQRLSFEVLLSPDGTVTANYDGLDNVAEQGGNAVVGIEGPDGEDGFTYSSDEASLANGKAVVFTRPDVPGSFDTHNLTGKVTDTAGTAVAGATVTLDPSGLTTTTAANGTYTFYGVVADTYTISTGQAGRCNTRVEAQVDVFADTVRDLQLARDYGLIGYACTTGASGYVAASTVLALTGDDVEMDVTVPFPVKFYGRSHNIAVVSTNGWVGIAGGYLQPFMSDLVVDGSASVRTQSAGTAPNRSFTIEWRNALIHGSSDRITFELVLHEDGRAVFHYGALSTNLQKGSQATIGLEGMSGRVPTRYSTNEPALTGNSSITWTPAASGTVSGMLTEAVTTTPLAGKTITLNPGNRTTTTDANGAYQFTGVSPGAYLLAAAPTGSQCLGQYASQEVYQATGDTRADLSISPDADPSYTCTTGTQAYIPGDTVQTTWTGDDAAWQATAPFPITLYGQTTTTPWISTNGLITLGGPWIGAHTGPIPDEGGPNAAIYPFWGDWLVDSSAAIVTKTSGTAPNRQWVVEWRNVAWWGNDAARVSFEVIFAENGAITFAYQGINPDNPIERGAEATVGIENADGTTAFQYLYSADLLADGVSVRFQPKTP